MFYENDLIHNTSNLISHENWLKHEKIAKTGQLRGCIYKMIQNLAFNRPIVANLVPYKTV